MTTQTAPQPANSTTPTPAWKLVLRFVVTSLFMLAILFIAAGRIDWWEAWAYVGMSLILLLGSRAALLLKNPDLAQERAAAGGRGVQRARDGDVGVAPGGERGPRGRIEPPRRDSSRAIRLRRVITAPPPKRLHASPVLTFRACAGRFLPAP